MSCIKIPVNLIKGFIINACSFVVITSSALSFFPAFQKDTYNYAFHVSHTDRCPMNELEWQAAAARIGCNNTRGYHCVPDKFHESLIEFCYNKIRILVSGGNCLELAANGILNHVNCQNFCGECPDKTYFSDEIYKYPVCLNIEFGCFTSDIRCLRKKLEDKRREMPTITTTKVPEQKTDFNNLSSNHGKFQTELLPLLFPSLIMIITNIATVIICIRRKKRMNKKTLKRTNVTEEQVELAAENEEQTELISRNSEAAEKLDNIFKQDLEKSTNTGDFNVIGEVESELMFDSVHLLLQLRRHCRNGNFKNFDYLLKTSLEEQVEIRKRILTLHDKDGYNLLHCASEGGSIDIFKALVNATNQIKVDDTTYDGRTVLHIACKHNNISLCRLLLLEENYRTLLLHKKSTSGWNAAHYAAVGGSIEILNLLENNGLYIKIETLAGLNVLDIACLHKHEEFCKVLMNRDGLNLSLDKSDAYGWTIAHFAAMVDNDDVFDHLIKKKVQPTKTYRQKTVLHVCCEYGNYKVCKRILNHFKEIVFDKDNEDWNALHYAAKGGNLKVYKEVEKLFKESTRLCKTTRDKKTVLHIACIYNSTDVCHYICNEIAYQGIINSKAEFKRWTAVHFVAVELKEDGAEEKLIRILVKSGIDVKAVTTDGLTVLGVACEHRNRKLINYLLKNHNELLGVKTPNLKNAAKASNDKDIESQINEALEIYEGNPFNIKIEETM